MKIAEFKALKFGTKIIKIVLNVTKVMTSYIQEPWLNILVKFQSGPKGLWVPGPILAT